MASLFNRMLVKFLPAAPGFLMWPVAKRYIAGSNLEDALRVTRDLNGIGATVTLDILGEEIRDLAESHAIAEQYVGALDAIHDEGLGANVSIKLSAFGIRLDPDVARDLVSGVLARARQHGIFVRLDMEDSSLTQATLDLYRDLRPDYPDIGVVLQAMLHRTVADAEALAAEGARIRLVKGIYLEPADIAHTGYQEIRDAYVRILDILLEGRGHVAIATHDGYLIQQARRLLRTRETPPDRYEFQMLLGVREPLRDALIGDGLALRVYVPFGRQWRAYSIRRMKENPQLAGHVVGALVPWRR